MYCGEFIEEDVSRKILNLFFYVIDYLENLCFDHLLKQVVQVAYFNTAIRQQQ